MYITRLINFGRMIYQGHSLDAAMDAAVNSGFECAVEGYGAEVVLCEPNQQAREATAAEIETRTGATFIHPYNNLDVMAGQGTATLELDEQARELGCELDAVITPVGGGGLLSGLSLVARALPQQPAVWGAEPALAVIEVHVHLRPRLQVGGVLGGVKILGGEMARRSLHRPRRGEAEGGAVRSDPGLEAVDR